MLLVVQFETNFCNCGLAVCWLSTTNRQQVEVMESTLNASSGSIVRLQLASSETVSSSDRWMHDLDEETCRLDSSCRSERV